MKTLTLLVLSVLVAPLSAEVEYARVVKETSAGYIQHPAAAKADFRAVFADFDPQSDGEKSDDATFGAPRMLAVRIDGKTYLIQVDNTPGVFTLYRAARKGNTWVKTRGSRTIHHPGLYEQLRAAGLNIHTTDELKAMTQEARQKALSGKDSPIKP